MDKNPVLTSQYRLVPAKEPEVLALYQWFSNQKQISSWGGPGFDYPMSEQAFLANLRINELASYWLKDRQDKVLGFGQFYPRLHKYHLGRLVISPESRGEGLGKQLVQLLLEEAKQGISLPGLEPHASLFVLRDNPVAIKCYQSLGFVEQTYPGEIPAGLNNCAYMTKAL